MTVGPANVKACKSVLFIEGTPESKINDTEDISRLVTVTVEEEQINTPDCSPGAFIRQKIKH